MEIIQLLLAILILGFIYKKMLKWSDTTITKKQAYIPVALGVFSPILSFLLLVCIALSFKELGYQKESIENPMVFALFSAFLKAGLVEEITKLLMILLSIKLFRPKSVFECALIGAAVGIGFTLHEEFLYGGSLVGLTRFVTVLLHTALGVIMGKYVGMGMYNKKNNLPYKSCYALAVIIPIVLHTIFDTLTGFNPAIKAEDLESDEVAVEILAGALCVAVAAVWQCVVVRKLKKRAGEYLAMRL